MAGLSFSRSFLVSTGVAALLYILTLSILPHGGFWIVDNGCKFIQMEGAIRNGYQDLSIPWPGRPYDGDLLFNPLPPPFGVVQEGKIFGVFSHPFTLLTTLPNRAFGMCGLYILPLLAGLLVLPAVWRLAGHLPAPGLGRPLAVLTAALATPAWFYSVTFWEHMPAVCLSTWAVCLWWESARGGGRRALILSALLSGLAVYFRDEMIFFALLLAAMIFVVERRVPLRRVAVFSLVLLSSLLPLLLFQWWATGNPLGHHALGNAPTAGGLAEHFAKRPAALLALLVRSHESLPLSLALALPYLALWALLPRLSPRRFRRYFPVAALAGIGAGAVTAAGYLGAESPLWWMYRANALFAVSPVLVVAFLPAPGPGGMEEKGDSGNRHFLLHNSLRMIAAGYALILVLIVPHAIASGIHWGARLLLPVYPLLGVLAASGIARWWSSSRNLPTALHALPVLLLLLSIALQCYGLRLLHDRKDVTARLNEAVARRSERVIVVDDKLFLPDLASLFYERILVLLADREATIRLPELITRVGEERALFVLTGDPGETPEALGEVVADPRHFVSYHLRSVELPPHGR